MKIICTLENLKKAIFNTERVTGKQITLPILENILIETEKGRVKFSATNLEIGIVSIIGAKIEKEGKITVSAKSLSNIINNFSNNEENITLEANNNILQLVNNSHNLKIKGLNAEDFPIIPKTNGEFLFNLEAVKLKEAIFKLLTCISINETRPELTGVNCVFLDKTIYFAATDSFRLFEENFEIKDIAQGYERYISRNPSIIIPANTLAEIMRIISNLEVGEISVVIEENQIFFFYGDIYIVSRLINGKYPEYKQIIPKKFATRAVFKKEGMQRAIKIASVFTNNKTGEITLEINPEKKKIIIKAESQERGEDVSEIFAEVVGPKQEIIFNPRYVLDGVSLFNSPQVVMLANNNSSPVAIQEIKENGEVGDKNIYIVMPIKK